MATVEAAKGLHGFDVFEVFPRVIDELPAVPLPREQLSQGLSDSEPEEIPDW
jgi:hypothetical protein